MCCSYFKAIAGDAGASVETVAVEYLAKHTSEIMGISWTHAGDGLLVSGKAGEIAMQEVPKAEEHKSLCKPSRCFSSKQLVIVGKCHVKMLPVLGEATLQFWQSKFCSKRMALLYLSNAVLCCWKTQTLSKV